MKYFLEWEFAQKNEVFCKTIIAMGLNRYEIQKSLPDYAHNLCPDYDSSLDETARSNGWSDLYTVLGLSYALKIDIW